MSLANRRLTAMEFLNGYQGVEGRWELVDGMPTMIAGGSRHHAEVAGNRFAALKLGNNTSGANHLGQTLEY